MDVVTVKGLRAAGHKDAEELFTKIALAGGFGAVAPSHQGGLDIAGLEGAAKTAVEKLLGQKTETKKDDK